MPLWVLDALKAVYGTTDPSGSPTGRLTTFLNAKPPNNDGFLSLLQQLCDQENNHTLSIPLATCMLQWLASPEGGGLFPKRISWIEIFRQSVTKLVDDPRWAQRDPTFECASSTKVIWDYAGDLL